MEPTKFKDTPPSDNGGSAHPLVEQVIGVLMARAQTIGFAESCTGGLLSAIFTRRAGVSAVYMGSVVVYSNESKERLLGVPHALIRAHGAVSLPVARSMAEGARQELGTSWAISITGIAGPGGGSPEKPVGTVCFAVVGPGREGGCTLIARRVFKGDRRQIQRKAAIYALRLLLKGLGEKPVQKIKKR